MSATLPALTGRRFASLTVLRHAGGGYWLCRCDCGRLTLGSTRHLKYGAKRCCRICTRHHSEEYFCDLCGLPIDLADPDFVCCPGGDKYHANCAEQRQDEIWSKHAARESMWSDRPVMAQIREDAKRIEEIPRCGCGRIFQPHMGEYNYLLERGHCRRCAQAGTK